MHTLIDRQFLPVSIEQAWDFFSSPANLSSITPPHLSLNPVSEIPAQMYPGMFIHYRVRPVAGIPLRWVTEITQVQAPFFFVDEQRLGPYRIWHHEHHFKGVPGGVEMTDIVNYRLPFGIAGILLQKMWIGRQVKEIFDYRRQRLEDLFGR